MSAKDHPNNAPGVPMKFPPRGARQVGVLVADIA
jgi:hypothetical protein